MTKSRTQRGIFVAVAALLLVAGAGLSYAQGCGGCGSAKPTTQDAATCGKRTERDLPPLVQHGGKNVERRANRCARDNIIEPQRERG